MNTKSKVRMSEAEFEIYCTELENKVNLREQELEAANKRLEAEILERKRIESEMRNLVRLPDESPSPILRISDRGVVLYANEPSRPFLQMWGCEIGGTVPSELRQTVSELLIVQTQRIENIVCNGRVYNFALVPIIDEGYVNFYGRDITVRKRAEDRMRFQANLLANITDVVYATDMHFRIIAWNKAAEKAYGYKEKEMIGKSIFAVFGPALEPEMRTILDRNLTEIGPVSARIVQTAKSGKQVVFDSVTMLLRDYEGTPIGFVGVNRDITERDRAVDALRESEQKSSAILNAANESIFLMDLGGTILSANETAIKRLGMKSCDVIGKNCYDLLPPDVGKIRKAKIEEMIACGAEVRFEDERDGIIFDHTFCPVRNAHGDISGVAIFSKDISGRKQAEEALRTSKERLSAIFDGVSETLMLLDLDGNVLAANKKASDRLNNGKPDFVGKNLFDLLPVDFHENRKKQITEMVRMKKPVKFRDYFKENVLDLTFYPIFDPLGNVVQFVSFAVDITEQVAAEKALRESEERFKAIAETTPVGIGVIGLPESVFLYVNPAYLKGFGYEESEVLGKEVMNIYFNPQERTRVLNILKKHGSIAEYEVRLKRKDGTPFWSLSSVRPITYNGKPALLGTFVDISDRKYFEEQIKRDAEDLRQNYQDLSRFNRAMVGRELRMIEMKKEINELCQKLGEPGRYDLTFDQN